MDKDEKLKQMIKEEAINAFKEYSKGGSFTDRKLTDTPTDSLQVVNRKYVTNNGTVASRPTSPVAGQPYFATDTNIPMTFDGTNWRNGVGSVVALG